LNLLKSLHAYDKTKALICKAKAISY